MRLYICYVITAAWTFWVVLFFYGVSAGFASYVPIAALVGSVILFVVASPLLLYRIRKGLVIGLISCLLILPYNVGFVVGIFDDGVFNLSVLVAMLPSVLLILSVVYTVMPLLVKRDIEVKMPSSSAAKLLLSGIPIVLFLVYLIFYGQYWSWQMFIV